VVQFVLALRQRRDDSNHSPLFAAVGCAKRGALRLSTMNHAAAVPRPLLRYGSSVLPNPSLERTSAGKALGPRNGQYHHPLRGPSALPVASAQLKR
jgi:hypothetical protein